MHRIYSVNMVTELVTFKMDSSFLKKIDSTIKSAGFHNRTEFIRAALREKLEEVQKKRFFAEVDRIRKSGGIKISPEEYERIREESAKEVMREVLLQEKGNKKF
jgi:Arc/MetJ-type ribon-helix-helix transcriptional regulator